MNNHNNARARVQVSIPNDLPIMYSYQLIVKIETVGKAEPEIREVKLCDTNPDDALARAQKQIIIPEKPGQIVEWFVNFAGELVPNEAMEFYISHRNSEALANKLLPILEELEEYHGDNSTIPLRKFYESLL